MNEKEAKRLLVARIHSPIREDGSPVDVMNEMSDEDIEHVLHVYGDDDAEQARFHHKAEHEAYLRKQYDGGGGKTSRAATRSNASGSASSLQPCYPLRDRAVGKAYLLWCVADLSWLHW